MIITEMSKLQKEENYSGRQILDTILKEYDNLMVDYKRLTKEYSYLYNYDKIFQQIRL